jgi:hypothetical protein
VYGFINVFDKENKATSPETNAEQKQNKYSNKTKHRSVSNVYAKINWALGPN